MAPRNSKSGHEMRQKAGQANSRSRRAFTLIEVMIVLAIILALATLVVVNLRGTREDAKKDTAKINLQTLAKALERFNDKINRYPTDDEGLKALWDKSSITDENELKNWTRFVDQPENSEKDPWGTPWGYKAKDETSEENIFDLWSYGPDKQDGTDDDIHLRPRETDGSGTSGGTGNPTNR